MSVSINGSLEINPEELSEFVRAEIDGSDFGELMCDAVSESLSEWNLDQMESDINDLDGVTDRHDERLDDVQRDIEQLKELATENKEDWKAVRGGEISPEVDAALIRQQRRIEELEHAMLSVFEYLHDLGQRDLARGVKRFNDSLTDPTGE
jgi:hypothetical protein